MGHKVKPPWTPEQVQALTMWQVRGDVHPVICRYVDDDHAHPEVNGERGSLTPTPNGWLCTHCGATQDWAWDFMFKWPPKEQEI